MIDPVLIFYDRRGKPLSLEEFIDLGEPFDDYRLVARREDAWGLVSTVWLGIDHSYLGTPPPVIFESMYFDPTGEVMDMDRYATLEAAIEGHERMCKRWKSEGAMDAEMRIAAKAERTEEGEEDEGSH